VLDSLSCVPPLPPTLLQDVVVERERIGPSASQFLLSPGSGMGISNNDVSQKLKVQAKLLRDVEEDADIRMFLIPLSYALSFSRYLAHSLSPSISRSLSHKCRPYFIWYL
jgi:hypothetical protein